ncbi:MAG TPA: DUF998 domain-containing protein [Chryseosolibacter sp.]
MLTRLLLLCGIFSSLLYVAMNIFVPTQFPGYNQLDYTVSELSAIDAPTRSLWVPLGIVYELLMAAFAWGVIRSAQQNRRLRMVGFLMLGYSAVNVYWPPMHLRGVETTLSDTLHITWAFFAIAFMLSMMGYGATAFGKRFRIYTIATLIGYVIFGFLMSFEAPDIPKNLPTPYLGLWERIMIGLFLAWIVALALISLKRLKMVTENTATVSRGSRSIFQKSHWSH